MTNLSTAMSGLVFGFSLIIAIGPQNIFVLKQGLNKTRVGYVVAVCFFSDAALIVVGTTSMSVAIKTLPYLATGMYIGGAIFLVAYSAYSFKQFLHPKTIHTAQDSRQNVQSAAKTILICLAFTWLNPHVYLDTVVIMGTIATSYAGKTAWFTGGALAASLLWFSGLGYGARIIKPLYDRPNAARGIDLAVSVIMLGVAISLLTQLFD